MTDRPTFCPATTTFPEHDTEKCATCGGCRACGIGCIDQCASCGGYCATCNAAEAKPYGAEPATVMRWWVVPTDVASFGADWALRVARSRNVPSTDLPWIEVHGDEEAVPYVGGDLHVYLTALQLVHGLQVDEDDPLDPKDEEEKGISQEMLDTYLAFTRALTKTLLADNAKHPCLYHCGNTVAIAGTVCDDCDRRDARDRDAARAEDDP